MSLAGKKLLYRAYTLSRYSKKSDQRAVDPSVGICNLINDQIILRSINDCLHLSYFNIPHTRRIFFGFNDSINVPSSCTVRICRSLVKNSSNSALKYESKLDLSQSTSAMYSYSGGDESQTSRLESLILLSSITVSDSTGSTGSCCCASGETWLGLVS